MPSTDTNRDRDAEGIANLSRRVAALVRRFGVEPKVALLANSSFGSAQSESAAKMREATAILYKQGTDFEVDGEMHGNTALNQELRDRLNPHSLLRGEANTFIMPNSDAANLAYQLVMELADGTTRLAYGGMFGDTPHDGNFVADGLAAADLTPHPAMRELTWVHRPVTVARGRRANTIVVTNRTPSVEKLQEELFNSYERPSPTTASRCSHASAVRSASSRKQPRFSRANACPERLPAPSAFASASSRKPTASAVPPHSPIASARLFRKSTSNVRSPTARNNVSASCR